MVEEANDFLQRVTLEALTSFSIKPLGSIYG